MEVTPEEVYDNTTENTSSPLIETNNNDDIVKNVRSIIYRNRKRNTDSSLRSPLPPKRSTLDPFDLQDPRISNKYGLSTKPPFVIHIEKIIYKSFSAAQERVSENKESNDNVNTGIGSSDSILSNPNQRSSTGSYGIIAFGKRIFKHIDNFSSAYDLKTIGRNKFTVTFPDGNSANKFCDIFNEKSNIIFPRETWIAYIPSYRVVRQFVVRGIDDDDSPEDIIKNIRPPPDWDILWQPPFEASRLRKPVRTLNKDNTSSTKFVDSDSYIIRFRTTTVPPSVIYMGKRLHLIPFIEKVRRCQRCQRFGHVAKICRTP
ncbi:uncharacterized protein LOC115239511 isoform X1 [Formica exsecta]|uniref:uncharacterized protein LOC115239511 isoform X1 n=1 Tax=Formica exsecta TaxID=72781 RepID=UPI0011430D15|nr:uncharacterized protein LOC115239511 isoform X1 [Formica exsecta]